MTHRCRPSRALPVLTALLAAVLLAALAAPPVAAADDLLSPWDVARLRGVGDAVVSPDGGHVAYTLRVQRDPFEEENGPAWSELHVAAADGTSRGFVTGQVDVGDVAWTPDGSRVTFLAKRGDDEERALWAIPLDGGEATKVLSHDTGVDEYAVAPDGSHVAFLATEAEDEEAEELEEKGFDAEVFEEEWRPVKVWIAPLEDGVAGEPRALELDGSAADLHWSPAGGKLALTLAPTPLVDDSYMAKTLHVVDVESGEIAATVDHEGKLGQIAWSPDGGHLAFVGSSDLNDPREGRLLVVPASGGATTDLLPGFEGHVQGVAWADADTVVYLAAQRVRTFVGSIDLDGGGAETLVAAGETIWNELSRGGDGTLALVADSASHPDELFLVAAGGGAPERVTDSNPWLAGKRLAEQEVVTVAARDGLELDGILVHPLERGEGERVPLILSVHGGPEAHHTDGWTTSYSSPGQVAAGRGFAVLYLNYRGSTGRGVEFSKLSQGDAAGKEFDDLVDAVDHLIGSGLVDRDRVGITGGSYGGYATAWGSTYYSERFAAGVMFVGISQMVTKVGISDIPREEYLVHARKYPWDDWQFMLERSPLYHVEKAKTPLLILGGTADTRVHPSHSLSLYRFLKLRDQAPVRLVRYPGEGHGNRKAAARLDYNLRMLRWFEHYLTGDGGAPPPPEVDYQEPGTEAEEDVDGDKPS